MSIFKKKKVDEKLYVPVAELQVGNYLIKEWGRSAVPNGKVYNVPCITIEDAALTWRVSVESSHPRYTFLYSRLHWAELSKDGSPELPEADRNMIEYMCAITFFNTTQDFLAEPTRDESGEVINCNADGKYIKDVLKAMKSYIDRRQKEADAKQTPEEREKADAEALDEMRNPEKALDEV